MEAAQVSIQKKRGEHSSIHPPRSRAKKILVVEDESAISGVLGEILRNWGCAVIIATNGRDGLNLLKTEKVDGIILDLEMPIMNGYTMLDQLRWNGDQTPVIVMSGGVDSHALSKMMKEGAQGFLLKPFTLQTLHTQCRRCFLFDQKCDSLETVMRPRGR